MVVDKFNGEPQKLKIITAMAKFIERIVNGGK